MSFLKTTTLVVVSLLMLVCAPLAMAQHYEEEGHPGGDVPTQDTTVLPLIIPEANDYAPPPSDDSGDAGGAVAPIGGSAYIDFSSYYKSGSLAPAYTFSPSLKTRLRIPIIFSRTIEYWDGEATTSGLGDVALDLEYKTNFGSKGQQLRFTSTAKFPTGDNEAEDNDHIVPLGTGSLDFLGRLQYSRSTQKTGFVGTALYRYNSSGESVSGDAFGSTTTELTNGNLFVVSAFGRYNAKGPWWLHCGVSFALTGDGEQVASYVNNDDSSLNWTTENDISTKSSLVDIFPGISYDLGLISPYFGVRIPLSSSYDVDDPAFPHADRETSFVLQFTYNPKSMTSD